LNPSEAILVTSKIVSKKSSAACDLDGEMILLDVDCGVYFGLNSVGASIWKFIQSQRSVEEVVDAMMIEFKVDRAQCEAGVIGLLRDLASHGLIDVQGNGATA